MFVESGDVEWDALRQGDLINDVQLFGALNPNNIGVTGMPARDEPVSWTVHSMPKIGSAVVLSHSCEVDPANREKCTGIILAPVRDVNKATDPSRVQELIDSNVIRDGETERSFLKFFYLPPHVALPYDAGGIVDFSKLYSVRNKSYAHLLENKAAQMLPDAREAIAFKLGLYFFRTDQNPE